MIEHLQADALISFCLASLAESKGRQEECDCLTKRAIENMAASRALMKRVDE